MVATRKCDDVISLSRCSGNPATHILHLPNPRSNSSYSGRFSSISVSLPTTPTSATP